MPKKTEATYQELNDELERVLQELQREDLDVDDALRHYERGLELVGQLQMYLKSAENTVRTLQAKFGDSDE